MGWLITDGFRYIRTESGIHTVYTIEEATVMEKWKADNVHKSIPEYLKDYGLVVQESSLPINYDAMGKANKRVAKFFNSWDKLNNNLMYYQCVNKGLKYKDIMDPEVQKLWKTLHSFEKEIVYKNFSVVNDQEFFKLFSLV